MDGISTSSFGHRSTLSVSSLPSLFPRPAPESFVSLQSDRRVADIHISRDGDAFSRKVQEQSDRLTQIDPKLAEQYHAVIDLLSRTNPHAARHFWDFMDGVLEGANSTETKSLPSEQVLPVGLQVDTSVSVKVSAFVAEVRGRNFSIAQSEVEVNVSVQHGGRTQKKVDPVVLDLDGDGIETSGVDHGVLFDLEARDSRAQSSFVQGDDVLLALDRNEHRSIDNGSELFGTQHGAENGFEELKKFDDNRDGIVDHQDRTFSRLLGFRRQPSGLETVSLAQLGVRGVFTAYQNQGGELSSGDELLQLGSFRRSDGGLGIAADVGLSLRI